MPRPPQPWGTDPVGYARRLCELYGGDPDLLGRYQPRGATGYDDEDVKAKRARDEQIRLRLARELGLLGASRATAGAVLGCKPENVQRLWKRARERPLELRRHLPGSDIDTTLAEELARIDHAIEHADAP